MQQYRAAPAAAACERPQRCGRGAHIDKHKLVDKHKHQRERQVLEIAHCVREAMPYAHIPWSHKTKLQCLDTMRASRRWGASGTCSSASKTALQARQAQEQQQGLHNVLRALHTKGLPRALRGSLGCANGCANPWVSRSSCTALNALDLMSEQGP